MKTLGIIGGIGPESTIDYYRQIIAAYREQKPDGSYPPILINSIDMTQMLGMAGGDLPGLTEYLLAEIRKLSSAGAAFGLLASNTPHLVFDELRRQSPLPLISIVEAACAAVQAQGLLRVGLFGTRLTMGASFYPDVFARAGIQIVAPTVDEQEFIHHRYMQELVKGVLLQETRRHLLDIVDRLIEQERIQGLVLGGTELPLLLREPAYRGLPFFDTTRIHVELAIREMLV